MSPIPHFMHKLLIQEMVQLLKMIMPGFLKSLNSTAHWCTVWDTNNLQPSVWDSKTESPQPLGKFLNLAGLRVLYRIVLDPLDNPRTP